MSSFATAPTRAPEKEAQKTKQLRLLTQTEAPSEQDASPAESAAGAADEVTRVERLLAQLEARSMALVPYGYGALREVPAKRPNTGLIAAILVAMWLTILVLGIAYIRYSRLAQPLDRATSPAAPLIIPSAADPVDQKVATSVDHLTKALVSSSERLNEMQAALERSNKDIQRIAAKVNDHPTKPALTGTPKTDALEIGPPAGSTAELTLPKSWHRVLDIKPTDSAVPHKGDDGTLDYWLVPRGAEKVQTKVLPIGTSPEGVVVHNLEDGKDYTLTPSGEWRNGAIAPAAN